MLVEIMKTTWHLPADRVQQIPNGIDTDKFRPVGGRSRRNEVVVGTVGHLRPEKRQDMLIRACARIRSGLPIRLVIAGDGPERANLEAVAREAGFAERVTFLGHRHDPAAVYSQFDVFALTSSTEQMPLSVLEAMACGLPVASLDVGDVKEMVCPENRRMIAGEPGSFEVELARLTEDEGLRRRLGEANREHCERTYSAHRMFEQYKTLFEETLR
jgi:glycosyltransferase involved in cell wall biosynthesis